MTYLRQLKQPLEYPFLWIRLLSVLFVYLPGQLISEAGLKGYRNQVEVSEKHASFMVNVDNGTAKDYEDPIAHVIEAVEAHSGVRLEPEVRIISRLRTLVLKNN